MPEWTASMEKALALCPGLQNVDFWCLDLGSPASALPRHTLVSTRLRIHLSRMRSLVRLQLSSPSPSAVTFDDLTTLVSPLRNLSIVRLHKVGDAGRPKPDGSRQLVDALASLPLLKKLWLAECPSIDDGWGKRRWHGQVDELRIEECGLGLATLYDLCLAFAPTLNVLIVRDRTRVGPEPFHPPAPFKALPVLDFVSFSGGDLTDFLLAVIARCPAVEHLDLSENDRWTVFSWARRLKDDLARGVPVGDATKRPEWRSLNNISIAVDEDEYTRLYESRQFTNPIHEELGPVGDMLKVQLGVCHRV